MNDSEITLQILVNDDRLYPSINNTLGLSTGVKGTLQTGRLFQFGIVIFRAGLSAEEIAEMDWVR